MLWHDAVQAPGSQSVIEAFVSRAYCVQTRKDEASIVELGEIRHTQVAG